MLFYLHDLVRLWDSWERDQILYIVGSPIPNTVYFLQKKEKKRKKENTILDWKAEGEGDDRGWDGWMASPAQ